MSTLRHRVPQGATNSTSEARVPEGWALARLQTVCSKIVDGTHHSPRDQRQSGRYRYITAKNIKSWGIDLSDVTFLPETTHRSIFRRCDPEKGDVLYIKDGATTGVATVNELDEQFSLLSSVALLKPRRDIVDPYYLKWYLNSPSGYDNMTGQMTGSAIKRLTLHLISNSVIPLAPLREQRRIVANAEDLLARVNAARERLARVPEILNRFRQAVLAAACSGRLTEDRQHEKPEFGLAKKHPARHSVARSIEGMYDLPDSWTWVHAGDAYADAGYGTSIKCEREPLGGVPVLRVPNIARGRLDLSDLKYAPKAAVDSSSLLVRAGDLLVCRTNGSLDLVGKAAVVPPLPERYSFASYLIRLRLDAVTLLPEYFHAFLSGPVGRDQIQEKARTTAGQFNLNLDILRNLAIPLPPVVEQRQIVRRVEVLFKLADTIARRVAGAIARADRLTQAILAKAFRGELVPTEAKLARGEGRDFEAASVLLERVRAQRMARDRWGTRKQDRRRRSRPMNDGDQRRG